MKTKFLYILTSDEKDIYLEQIYISVFSLKMYTPEATVILLIDDKTNETIKDERRNILKYIDKKIVIKLDKKLNNMKRSRFLKTSARQYLDGDFLYIDSDTIITENLSDVDNLEYNIMAVKDIHLPSIKDHINKKSVRRLTRLISCPVEKESSYFNSGILYVKDTEEARYFFKQWHYNWLKGVEKGIYIDQISYREISA
jgi:lipopolysaccharide biosynthesis glycosyltransferase